MRACVLCLSSIGIGISVGQLLKVDVACYGGAVVDTAINLDKKPGYLEPRSHLALGFEKIIRVSNLVFGLRRRVGV